MAGQLLEGKVAIVTGAGSPIGIGHAITVALVRAGARVAMMDINREWLDESVNEVREIGGDDCAAPILADVTDAEAVEAAVKQTIAELGGLHILVNNAGTNPSAAGLVPEGQGNPTRFWDVSIAAWTRVITVNVSGPFLMARAVVGHMMEQGWGRIIGVTTSLDTMLRNVPYGPSKASHEAFVAAMARDLEGTGVTANVLVPGGGTNTNFNGTRGGRRKGCGWSRRSCRRRPSGWRRRNRTGSTAGGSTPASGTSLRRLRSAWRRPAGPQGGRSWGGRSFRTGHDAGRGRRGVLALSLALVWGYGGILCFGQTAFFGLGAYAYTIAAINFGGSSWAILVAVLVAVAFAVVLGYVMFYGRVSDVYLAVITLTVSLILYSLIRRTSGPDYRIGKSLLGGFNGITSPPLNVPWDTSFILFPEHLFYVAMAALIVAYVLTSWLTRTHFGRVCVSIRENELRTELLGYDVRLYKLGIFAAGAGIAGLAGVLFCNGVGRVTPDVFNLYNAALTIIWVIVGGRGTLVGPVLGAFALFYLTSALGTQSTINNNLVLGIILVVFVLAVPKGVVPTVADWFTARRSRRSLRARERRMRMRRSRAAAAGNGEAE